MENEKISIAGLNLAELEKLLSPLPRFRALQIYKWITKGASCFEQMKNIPLNLRSELNKNFLIFSSCHDNNDFSLQREDSISDIGAKKFIFTLRDGLKIESVILSDGKNRLTACLSTQAGCPCACVFCKTGALAFKRNLDSREIVEQFLHLRNLYNNNKNTGHIIDNIVVMGMGEPLLNLANLRKAISIFNEKEGINFSLRRITVSTCGIYEGIIDLAQNGPFFKLAVSLTTADDDLRQKLMPVAKSNPLYKIKEALMQFQLNGGGRVTLEVPLLSLKGRKGLNTNEKDAKAIADFSKGINTVINLIPWNPVEGLMFDGLPLCEPSKDDVKNFEHMLKKYNLNVTMRLHKGRSVMGACGQLGQ
ncbi:MAG: 23S rRNA (adenine(2503)-C(2))-methyltransferase RlmN [Treponema sp.]|nr:23S rRNA (adenine(2503)-C(2))-methyltransferase RlmN [Treponema sp.]